MTVSHWRLFTTARRRLRAEPEVRDQSKKCTITHDKMPARCQIIAPRGIDAIMSPRFWEPGRPGHPKRSLAHRKQAYGRSNAYSIRSYSSPGRCVLAFKNGYIV